MGGLGMRELVVILLVVLVVFGAKKLRTVGSDLGAAVRGFKKAMSDGEEEQNAPPRFPLRGSASIQRCAKNSSAVPRRRGEKLPKASNTIARARSNVDAISESDHSSASISSRP